MITPPFPETPEPLRGRVARVLHGRKNLAPAKVFRVFHMLLVLWGVAGVVLASDPTWGGREGGLVRVPLILFFVELLLRLWVAPELYADSAGHPWAARQRWLRSPMGMIDVLSVALIPALLSLGALPAQADLAGILWMFKLARYSQGLAVLGRVILLEAEPLSGVLFAFLVILLCAASLAHILEGQVQPEQFGTVPRALWWTIVTLTTTGYGDITPVTGPGKVLGGLVMMCGIAVFALWAGILATGFSQEMKRRAFLKTWDMIAHVSLFRDAGAAVITEVAQRLRLREVTAGTTVVRKGDDGDCMYFIVAGAVEIQVPPRPVIVRSGEFFGEMALLTGGRRSATAVAVKPTTLLILDIADFRDLVARYPELNRAIHEEAERRLRESRRRHEHLVRTGDTN